MSRFDNEEFNLQIDETINEVFDEAPGSNSFLALRKLRWSDSGQYKLDIRKWYTNSEGKEIAGKGISFMTEDGPSNLINALLKHGYGNTEDIIESLKDRDDFLPSVKKTIDVMGVNLDDVIIENESIEALYFDPKNMFEESTVNE